MQDSVAGRGGDGGPREVLARLERAGYRAGSTQIIADLSLEIAEGGAMMLVGPNGAGKSTLLKLLMGLLAPTEGQVASASPAQVRKAIVFQRPVMLRRSTAANVAFALRAAGRWAEPETVRGLLARVSLDHLEARPARRLSAGEQQRLALARALARDPELLLLDEPTASLDPAATKAVEDIVRDISSAGVKVVMATHDLGQARRLGQEIVLLVAGRIAEQASAAHFFERPATEAGRRFLAGELVLPTTSNGNPACA